MDKAVQVGDVDACLSHGIALAQGDGIVFECLVVDGDAEGGAYGILATVALADGVFFVVVCGEVEFEVIDNLACLFRQPVFADQGHDGAFDGSQRLGQVQHYAGLAVLEGLLFVGRAQYAQEHTVDADGCLDDVGRVAFVELGVEVLYLLAGEFLVLRQVEVGTRVDAFDFLESEGHTEFNVGGGVGVVCQFFVVVEAIFVIAHAEGLVPCQTPLFPLLEPLEFFAGAYKELHFHLLELAHTEDELACDNLVAEGLAYLCDAEGYAHTAGLLDVEVVDKDALSGLGTQVYGHGTVGGAAHFGAEHQVELTYVRPVLGAGYGADDFFVDDDLAQLGQVVVVHSLGIALVQRVAAGLMLEYAGVGLTEQCFVKALAEAFGGFLDFFVNLVVVFGYLVFDEHVGAIALLGVAVVNQGIVEGIHVTRSFPDGRVHKDGRIQAYDILVQQGHRFPPVTFDIVFELDAVLAVVIHCGQAVVNFAGGEYESVLFGVRNYLLEDIFLLCHIYI